MEGVKLWLRYVESTALTDRSVGYLIETTVATLEMKFCNRVLKETNLKVTYRVDIIVRS